MTSVVRYHPSLSPVHLNSIVLILQLCAAFLMRCLDGKCCNTEIKGVRHLSISPYSMLSRALYNVYQYFRCYTGWKAA